VQADEAHSYSGI